MSYSTDYARGAGTRLAQCGRCGECRPATIDLEGRIVRVKPHPTMAAAFRWKGPKWCEGGPPRADDRHAR